MMHRCNMQMAGAGGGCTCGMYQTGGSFSMLFSMNNGYVGFDEGDVYSLSSSPTSPVDCTLSLGTPSTRLTDRKSGNRHEKKRSSFISGFGWNIFPSKHTPPPSAPKNVVSRGGINGHPNGDSLLSRRCANCDTTSTPLWRNGPRGPKSLCNACGIRYKKEERRAAAGGNGNSTNGAMETQQMMSSGNSWGQPAAGQRGAYYPSPYTNEYRFMEEDEQRDSETSHSLLSWRFNMADHRRGLVHDNY